MLTALQLARFKAFGDLQRVPIKPITLIYGPNSAGKSSLIHSLILARQAAETGELDVHRTPVGGDSVDLGGFRQYVHRRNAGERVEWAMELDTSRFTGRLATLLAAAKVVTARVEVGLAHEEKKRKRFVLDPRTDKAIEIEEPTGEMVAVGQPAIQSFKLEADSTPLLEMSRRPSGGFRLDRLHHGHAVFREVIKAIVAASTTTESLQPSDYEGLDKAIDALVPDIVATCRGLLPDGLAKAEGPDSEKPPTLFPISKGRRQEDLAAAVRFFVPRTIEELLKGVSQTVGFELDRLHYLGPLRSYPPRHLAFAQHHDPNWIAGGGYAWDAVRRDGRVRAQVNEWLGAKNRLQTPYELTLRELVGVDQLETPISEGIENHLGREAEASKGPVEVADDLEISRLPFPDLLDELLTAINSADIEKLDELILKDCRSNTVVSHRDVGIGISQVLPVLVSAYASQDRLVAIEQPEIHLHPKLQAELGDVFLESALGERRNTFLLETHSEHVLLRIMKRMRQMADGSLPEGLPKVRPEDVAVLYVEPDGSRSIVREMPLNERGDLVKAWPGGFFEEGLDEMF